MGTEGRAQVTKQARRYRGKDVFCIWVFQDKSRFDWISAGDKGNTLMKLAGAQELYSLDGQQTTISEFMTRFYNQVHTQQASAHT